MKALVVYESMFGNTEAVARAVAEGLSGAGQPVEVDLREVAQAPSPVTGPVDLIVVGGPTHAFSLSRPSTRADAVKQGAPTRATEQGLREWLSRLAQGPHAERVTATDEGPRGHRHDRECPLDLAQGLLHPVDDSPAHRTCHQVDDAFGVG